MARYRYVKQYPKPPLRIPQATSYVLLSIGAGVLLWTLWPIISFAVFAAPTLRKPVSPIASSTRNDTPASPLAEALTGEQVLGEGSSLDYTNPNVWFPGKPQKKIVSEVNSYTVSIPKLGVEEALAIVSGQDLDKSLIHYGGTGLPGEYGNSVLFGHSTLPQFYDPTNYHAIFSTLPSLDEGDEIYIEYDNVQYKYTVFDKTVTEPHDLSPLEQRYDDSYLTVITCVPPGTYAQRLNVRAKLEQI